MSGKLRTRIYVQMHARIHTHTAHTPHIYSVHTRTSTHIHSFTLIMFIYQSPHVIQYRSIVISGVSEFPL